MGTDAPDRHDPDADQAIESAIEQIWPRRHGPMAARFAPLVALFLASGAALVLTIVARWSLPAALVVTVGITATLAAITFRNASPRVRMLLRRRLRAGFVAGLVATIAYDLTRFGVVSLLSLSLEPFHTIEVFGTMFVAETSPQIAVVAAGLAYHFCNGIAFGIAYTLVFRRPSVPTALAWAALLEVFMISLYPGWLEISKVDELALVSVLGHVAFGLALGLTARRMLADDHPARTARSAPVPPPPPYRGRP